MNINYTTEHLRIHMSRNVLVEMDLLLAEEKKKVRLLKEIGREMRTLLAGEKQKVLRLQQCCIGFQIALSNIKHYIDTVRPNESTPSYVRINIEQLASIFDILLYEVSGLYGSDVHAELTIPRRERISEE